MHAAESLVAGWGRIPQRGASCPANPWKFPGAVSTRVQRIEQYRDSGCAQWDREGNDSVVAHPVRMDADYLTCGEIKHWRTTHSLSGANI